MRMRKEHPDHYKFFPLTWILPSESSDFRNQFNTKYSKTFILKPMASCQGRGIFLIKRFEDVPYDEPLVA